MKPIQPSPVRIMAPALAGLLACSGALHAQGVKALSFEHKDWALQCDNTRTCRAVGYQDERGESEPVSMKITRLAGPNTPIEIALQVSSESGVKGTLRLSVGKTTLVTGLKNEAILSAEQARLLWPALLKNENAEIRSNDNTWTLSLAGLNAVLLKMDDLQGRVSTPGALIKRGNRSESDVPTPLPAPSVRAFKPVAERSTDNALAALIAPLLDQSAIKDQCNQVDIGSFEVYRLTNSRILLSLPCGMGAYNFSQLLWIANDKPPYAPQVVNAEGDFDPATGSVHSSMKVRGLGDCWWSKTWQFDGKGFTLTQESGDSMCRGFAGGAWQLPVYVTQRDN